MEFLKNNKKLVVLGLALLLAIGGTLFKVDVAALLKDVGKISTGVTNLVDDPEAPAPAPVE